uniref:Major facilitator superfamily associated domain-containing protein n=1 Tax=Timema poppense TaxID=170557 RepID=A0A7R9D1V9_TIMPO|nr:unnamed protein product [Timema poppensis]
MSRGAWRDFHAETIALRSHYKQTLFHCAQLHIPNVNDPITTTAQPDTSHQLPRTVNTNRSSLHTSATHGIKSSADLRATPSSCFSYIKNIPDKDFPDLGFSEMDISSSFPRYSIIYNPWLCLVFEAMESVTSSLSFTAAVTYAAKLSSTTTDTSIQGLLGGIYFGVDKKLPLVSPGVYHYIASPLHRMSITSRFRNKYIAGPSRRISPTYLHTANPTLTYNQ